MFEFVGSTAIEFTRPFAANVTVGETQHPFSTIGLGPTGFQMVPVIDPTAAEAN